MFYLKVFLCMVWFLLVSMWMCVLALFRFGDSKLNKDFSRFLSYGILPILGIEFEARGLENVPKTHSVVSTANHQSGLDVLTFGVIAPDHSVAIAKKELGRVPFFGFYYRAAGNLLIDRKNRSSAYSSISEAVRAIHEKNRAIWMFVEGTRNRGSDPFLPFKKGAFRLAIQAGVPILPYVSSPVKPVLDWKAKKNRGGKVVVQVLPEIPVTGLTEKDVDALMKKTRDAMLETYHALERELFPSA